MTKKEKSRMGILRSLKSLNNRFKTKPLSNPQHIQRENIKKSKPLKNETKSIKTTKGQTKNKSFVNLHIEVAKKVDTLIEQMIQDERFNDRL